jgi:phosphatidylglycerol:prolipoprotein diacylglycerol transferase
VQFPVYIVVGSVRLHPHFVFEALAYFIGFRAYLWLRQRRGDVIADGARWSIVAAAIAGAAVGSKVLYWFEDPVATWQHLRDPVFLLQGKTLVGGLLGGLIAVEATKRVLGVRESTGDLFAVPLAIGIAIGRIGCFLTGVSDATAGVETTLPWGVDFGDGVWRHPTQLYEALFMASLAGALVILARRPRPNGDLFKAFMVAYLAFRLIVDFLKPEAQLGGLSAIQWAAVAALIYYGPTVRRWASTSLAPGLNKVNTHGHA